MEHLWSIPIPVTFTKKYLEARASVTGIGLNVAEIQVTSEVMS